MVGVSPAYFISRYSNRFTIPDMHKGITRLRELGFDAFQLEVFHTELLGDWLAGAKEVARTVRQTGLVPSQFVAHFLGNAFTSLEAVRSAFGIEEMKKVVDSLTAFETCPFITVPFPAFEAKGPITHGVHKEIIERVEEKLKAFLEIAASGGRKIALEILPQSIPGSTEGLLRFRRDLGTGDLGLNFDTGHAWACKENIYLVPGKFPGGIFGTHLKDNFGLENLALRPGAGSIDWELLVSSLTACGYSGSWDVELIAPADSTDTEYINGKNHIQRFLKS